MTDLKFGILLWNQAASWDEMLDAARRVDRLGYEHLWAWDHLYAIFGDPYQDFFEGWSLLAAWARETRPSSSTRHRRGSTAVSRGRCRPRAPQESPWQIAAGSESGPCGR